MMNTLLPTANGGVFDLLNPMPDMVDPRDIAAHLSKLNRWVGGTFVPYSVAQHSIWCSRQVEQTAACYALLHDAREAYLGNASSPLKRVLASFAAEGERAPLDVLADRIDRAIFQRFRLTWPMPAHIRIAVKFADFQAMATERRDLCPSFPDALHEIDPLPAPHPAPIHPKSWVAAETMFLDRFDQLFGGRA